MYEITVLAADRSQDDIKELIANISSQNYTYKILGTYSDGNQLLAQILALHPDIVITEIMLPGLDGLEIMQKLHGSMSSCKFIVITESMDFQHAYAAIKYQVSAYLLKPFSKSELNYSLDRVAREIHIYRNALLKNVNTASRHLFLKTEINKLKQTDRSIDYINQNFGTTFEKGLFRAVIMNLHCSTDTMLIFDNDTFRNHLMRLAFEHLNHYCHDLIIDKMSDGVLILLNYQAANSQYISKEIESLFTTARNILINYSGVKVTLCISREYSELSKLPEAKHEVLDARWARKSIGSDKIIYWKDLLPYSENNPAQKQLHRLSESIVQAYETLDIEKIQQLLEDYFNLPQAVLNSRESRIFIRQLIDRLFEMYSNLNFFDTNHEELVYEFNYLINMASTFDNLKQAFHMHIAKVIKYITDNIADQYSKPVKDAIIYIKRNYQKNITLNHISREVNLAPTYFSKLFKKETGCTFSDYIALYKVEIAKTFLTAGEKNISEIAAALGYVDIRYFSKIFKKHVGIIPSEYKRIHLKSHDF